MEEVCSLHKNEPCLFERCSIMTASEILVFPAKVGFLTPSAVSGIFIAHHTGVPSKGYYCLKYFGSCAVEATVYFKMMS